ncbi:MAG: hypothetical protein KA184_09890 [Candidatus Hydrogenedentes bacterium]|nr:hypothetical protein [Candidatus Hydrogenedentota bacterium]
MAAALGAAAAAAAAAADTGIDLKRIRGNRKYARTPLHTVAAGFALRPCVPILTAPTGATGLTVISVDSSGAPRGSPAAAALRTRAAAAALAQVAPAHTAGATRGSGRLNVESGVTGRTALTIRSGDTLIARGAIAAELASDAIVAALEDAAATAALAATANTTCAAAAQAARAAGRTPAARAARAAAAAVDNTAGYIDIRANIHVLVRGNDERSRTLHGHVYSCRYHHVLEAKYLHTALNLVREGKIVRYASRTDHGAGGRVE